MKKFTKKNLISVFIFLICDVCPFFEANSQSLTPTSTTSIPDSGRRAKYIFNNISGDMYVYLRYVPEPDRFSKIQKFHLDLVPRKEDATPFTVEMVEMKDEKGNKVTKTLFNSLGYYMLANIITNDGKYLVWFFPPETTPIPNSNTGLYIQALDKLPTELQKGYAWLVFHDYQLDEYFFQPMVNDFWYLQRMQHKAVDSKPWVDVLPYTGNTESTGRAFIYWKLEKQ